MKKINSTEESLDSLADILWWIKGYIAGTRDNFEECPFGFSHLEALRLARVDLVPLLLPQAESESESESEWEGKKEEACTQPDDDEVKLTRAQVAASSSAGPAPTVVTAQVKGRWHREGSDWRQMDLKKPGAHDGGIA